MTPNEIKNKLYSLENKLKCIPCTYNYSAKIGTEISFNKPYIYNTPSSAATGDITENLVNAKIGIVQKIYHEDGSAPSFPAGWVRWGTGDYVTSELNEIFCEWIEGTTVHYWIRQQA